MHPIMRGTECVPSAGESFKIMKQLGMVLAHTAGIKRLLEYNLERAELIIFNASEKKELMRFMEDAPVTVSGHCPIFIPEHYHENPLLASLLDFDRERRFAGLELMKQAARDAAELGAEYVVVHTQRPEHFGGANPDEATRDEALDILMRSCDILMDYYYEFGVPFYLENQMDNAVFNRAQDYIKLLEKFPDFGFCLDIGHLDMDSRKFGFSFLEFIEQMLPFIKAVHLQNSNSAESDFNGRHWKIPVHPDQKTEDGWQDIEGILKKILGHNRDCVINFEARPDEIHGFDYMREGIMWIKNLMPHILREIDNSNEALCRVNGKKK